MSVRTKQVLKLLAKALVAGILLAWVFAQVDFEHFRETVRAARWQYLLGVWVATALFYWVQAVALQWILRKQDCDVRVNAIFGASCVTSLYSLILPGFVSTGVKWYILKRTTGKGANVLSAMLYNHLTLTIVMTMIGLVGLILVNPTRVLLPDTEHLWVVPLVCGVLLVLLVLISLLALNEPLGRPVLRWLTVALGPRLGRLITSLGRLPVIRWLGAALRPLREKGRTVLMQIAAFQSAGWRFHLAIGLINLVDALLVGWLMYLFAARAASVDVPAGVLIWLCAIVFVLGKVPITIAALGVREVTLVAFLAGYGIPQSAALLMSMILFSSLIFLAALGLVYQLLWALQARRGRTTYPPAGTDRS